MASYTVRLTGPDERESWPVTCTSPVATLAEPAGGLEVRTTYLVPTTSQLFENTGLIIRTGIVRMGCGRVVIVLVIRQYRKSQILTF